MLIQVNKVSGNGISETITPYHTDINDFRGFPIVAGKTTNLFFYCLRLERLRIGKCNRDVMENALLHILMETNTAYEKEPGSFVYPAHVFSNFIFSNKTAPCY